MFGTRVSVANLREMSFNVVGCVATTRLGEEKEVHTHVLHACGQPLLAPGD